MKQIKTQLKPRDWLIKQFYFSLLLIAFSLAPFHWAQAQEEAPPTEINLLDELDPYDPNIEETLKAYDKDYEEETGQSALIERFKSLFEVDLRCYRQSCPVWAYVNKSQQSMTLYVNGRVAGQWLVSTGIPGHGTPNFDTHPDGRIYDAYTSKKFPGGDYKGLGNMPYAVFISGGFAIHGTPQGNWSKLGSKASHGCIRLYPDYAYTFNRLVRSYGVNQTWITVQ